MEVFTLCDCDNLTNSFTAHYNQQTNHSRNSHSVNKPLPNRQALSGYIRIAWSCGLPTQNFRAIIVTFITFKMVNLKHLVNRKLMCHHRYPIEHVSFAFDGHR